MCNETYGLIIYNLNIRSKNNKDVRTFTDIKTNYTVANLLPFTDYVVDINTARDTRNLNNFDLYIKTIYNFTTLPGSKYFITRFRIVSSVFEIKCNILKNHKIAFIFYS